MDSSIHYEAGFVGALVQWFHTETSTFHLSCGEYAVLLLDWTAILGIRFCGHKILAGEMSFDMACKLLGIPLSFTAKMRGNFGPTTSP